MCAWRAALAPVVLSLWLGAAVPPAVAETKTTIPRFTNSRKAWAVGKDYQQAVEWYNVGAVHFNAKDYATAARYFGAVLTLYPTMPQPRFFYAWCLTQLGRSGQALPHVQYIVQVWPEAPEFAYLLATVQRRLAPPTGSGPAAVAASGSVTAAPTPGAVAPTAASATAGAVRGRSPWTGAFSPWFGRKDGIAATGVTPVDPVQVPLAQPVAPPRSAPNPTPVLAPMPPRVPAPPVIQRPAYMSAPVPVASPETPTTRPANPWLSALSITAATPGSAGADTGGAAAAPGTRARLGLTGPSAPASDINTTAIPWHTLSLPPQSASASAAASPPPATPALPPVVLPSTLPGRVEPPAVGVGMPSSPFPPAVTPPVLPVRPGGGLATGQTLPPRGQAAAPAVGANDRPRRTGGSVTITEKDLPPPLPGDQKTETPLSGHPPAFGGSAPPPSDPVEAPADSEGQAPSADPEAGPAWPEPRESESDEPPPTAPAGPGNAPENAPGNPPGEAPPGVTSMELPPPAAPGDAPPPAPEEPPPAEE